MKFNRIYNVDVLEGLKQLADESVDCVITSPPYWALRDYGDSVSTVWDGRENCEHDWKTKSIDLGRGSRNKSEKQTSNSGSMVFESKSDLCVLCGAWRGQLGLEPTFDLYLKHLLAIFVEVKRVLKKSGSVWVNIGDTFSGAPASGQQDNVGQEGSIVRQDKVTKLPDKCLVGVPERFMLGMIDNGWILRNKIVWHKPNCMPSSARDRFTVDFEPIYFFVKSKRYYFDMPREPAQEWGTRDRTDGKYKTVGLANGLVGRPAELGRSARTVWKITTQPFSEAHFATFPEELVKKPLLAGCPEFVCKSCGKPREKIMKPTEEYDKYLKPHRVNDVDKQKIGNYLKEWRDRKGLSSNDVAKHFPSETGGITGCVWNWENGKNIPTIEEWGRLKEVLGFDAQYDKVISEFSTQEIEYNWEKSVSSHHSVDITLNRKESFVGWSDCGCNAGWNGGVVLDPFMGSGTVALVARKNSRQFIGFELNKEYVEIANKRLKPYMEQRKLEESIYKTNGGDKL